VLDGVIPVEDLHRVGAELVGERPVACGTVADPDHRSDLVDVLDLERLFQHGRECAEAVHHRDAARCAWKWLVRGDVVPVRH